MFFSVNSTVNCWRAELYCTWVHWPAVSWKTCLAQVKMEVPRFEQNAPNPNVIQILDTSSSFEEAQDEQEDENAIVVAAESNSVDIEINQNQRLIPGVANEENLPRKADRSGRGFCTIPVAVFLGCTNVFMILMVFLLPIACNRKGETPAQACFLEPFSWLLYTHTFYWFCHLLGDQYLKVFSSLLNC